MLIEGFHRVPAGMIATTVTHLEMRNPVLQELPPWPREITLERVSAIEPERYRALFRRVGTDWLWVSRLRCSDKKLTEILMAPGVELWVVQRGGEDLGICELDLRNAPATGEIAFFGLAADLQGRGLARHLIQHAVSRAAAASLRCFTVHTCTLDHPAALPFYMRNGFTPVRQEVEVLPDPRLDGLLPKAAAPHVPLIQSLE